MGERAKGRTLVSKGMTSGQRSSKPTKREMSRGEKEILKIP